MRQVSLEAVKSGLNMEETRQLGMGSAGNIMFGFVSRSKQVLVRRDAEQTESDHLTFQSRRPT